MPKPKVLVADDDASIRELWSEMLTELGYEVIEAANGLEALLAVKHQGLAGVVLDLDMPRLGGLEALKRIQRFDPALTVVIATGNLDADVHRQALALGARAILTKPVSVPDLIAALGGAPASSTVPPTGGPSSPSTGEARAHAGSPCRILVVDDDPEVGAVLEELMTANGWSARSVTDGAQAVREILAAPPEIVLLDIDMPGLSGVDALQTIRAGAPEVTVIMVSGTTDADVARKTLALGAFDYVVKPVDHSYLKHSVEMALALKGLAPIG